MNKDEKIAAMKQNIIALHLRISDMEDRSSWIDAKYALPEAKEGWRHSEEVELYYPGSETYAKRHAIGHYHHEPPYREPCFVDWTEPHGRQPTHWRPLQTPVEPDMEWKP